MNVIFKRKNCKAKFFLPVLFILFTGIFITACENKIFGSWWEEPEEYDFDYVAIMKDIPIFIYETIIEERIVYETVYEIIEKIVVEKYPEYIYVPGDTVYIEKPLPPEILLQHINISDIQFVIFAGESTGFNGPPGVSGGTALTPQEIKTNTAIIKYFAEELKDKKYFAIFHGHANKITGSAAEALELESISTKRAEAVKTAVFSEYGTNAKNDLENRVSTRGYGGGRGLSGSNSSYAGLNRRVEAILFTIETVKVEQDKSR